MSADIYPKGVAPVNDLTALVNHLHGAVQSMPPMNLAVMRPADMPVQFDMQLLAQAVRMYKEQYGAQVNAPQFFSGQSEASEADRVFDKLAEVYNALPGGDRALSAALPNLIARRDLHVQDSESTASLSH